MGWDGGISAAPSHAVEIFQSGVLGVGAKAPSRHTVFVFILGDASPSLSFRISVFLNKVQD